MALLDYRYCDHCGRNTLQERQVLSAKQGAWLTIVTGGLFLFFWSLSNLLLVPFRQRRCQHCGRTCPNRSVRRTGSRDASRAEAFVGEPASVSGADDPLGSSH